MGIEAGGESGGEVGGESGSVRSRTTALIFWTAVLAVALRFGVELFRWAVSSAALPQWDMAKYAVSGQRLAAAVRDLDLAGWLAQIHALDVWPPTWPLVESVVFLLAGEDITVARGLVGATWMLLVVAVFWALSAGLAGEPVSLARRTGFLAALWVAQAPLLQALATVNLLEIPGLAFLFLALGCHLRALRTDEARWWRLTWLATLALFFCKYNYGLMWIVPLTACEVRRRHDSWREVAAWVVSAVRSVRWRRPVNFFLAIFLAIYAVSLAVLFVLVRRTGGWEGEILGAEVSVSSVGNPAYLLYLFLSLRVFARAVRLARQRDESLGTLRRRLDAATRGAVSWLILPIALWFLLPPHVKELVGFVGNRSSGVPWTSAERWLAYPRAVTELYAVAPWLGVLAMVLALPALGWIAGPSPGRRVVALTTLAAWAVILVHPYQLPRFAVQAATLTGVLAAAFLVSRTLRTRLRVVADGLVVLALALCLWRGPSMETVRADHALRTVPAALSPAVEASARAALDGAVILGTWNFHSPWLVEWEARQLERRDASWRPAGRRDVAGERELDAVVRGLGGRDSMAWIEADHPAWELENAWLAPLGEILRVAPEARLERRVTAESGAGWSETVVVYRRSD